MLGSAQTLRIATFNADLARAGPGVLLRDILKDKDPQIDAVVQVITTVNPDIIALQGIDYDLGLAALGALRNRIAQSGPTYPYIFALRPNTGMPTGLDMDGDGRFGRPRDAQGYGLFSGEGGMAILSRYPIGVEGVQDFSNLLWRDLPDALLPSVDGKPFPSLNAQNAQRLSTTGHWVVPISLPNDRALKLLTYHASPPVFDGPEDRNGKRNHDETRFWSLYLDGVFGPAPDKDFIILGDVNLDLKRSQGLTSALETLLADTRLQDPMPRSNEGSATVDWPAPGPGKLRVDYVLPAANLAVTSSAVHWPENDETARMASRHRLVWVDIALR